MGPVDIGFIVIGVMILAAGYGLRRVLSLFSRDRMFDGVAPGIIPPNPQNAETRRVPGGREYTGEVPVSFSPPRGLAPGLIGVLIDGSADPRDVTATLIDLARRGHVSIETIGANPSEDGVTDRHTAKASDWEITRSETPPDDALRGYEQVLIQGMFESGPTVLLSELGRRHARTVHATQEAMHEEVVELGWYDRNPQRTPLGLGSSLLKIAGVGLSLMIVASVVNGSAGLASLLGATLAGLGTWLVWNAGKPRVARTGLGTAVHIQALGFKHYLATAEADQIKFEEALDVFTKYLPYAIVFGVADHWAKVFGDVASRAEAAGYEMAFTDLDWFTGLVLLDAGGDMIGLLSSIDMVGGAELAIEGFSGVAEGIGDFISDLDIDFDF